jgi:hypothetical protein
VHKLNLRKFSLGSAMQGLRLGALMNAWECEQVSRWAKECVCD